MIIYNYDRVTKVFTGRAVADESPREPGHFLIPAHATTIEPPEDRSGYLRVFNDGAWGYVPELYEADPTSDPTPIEEMVIDERWRRLALGFEYDFGDERGIHRIGTTPEDLVGWHEVTTASNAAIQTGSPNFEIAITTDTGPCVVTAIEWQHILLAATAFRQPIFMASFELQKMSPIPLNFADDEFWP